MRDIFIEAGFAASDLRVIPNPAEPWSRRRIAAETNRRLLFVGRVGIDKGADIAVKAAHAVNVPITIVGSGELLNDLAARFPNAQLIGWCDRHEIAAAATRARALIAPSRVVEPFGLAILEAATSGLPVLVSDRAYLAQDAEREGFGIAFDPTDLKGLARLLSRIDRDDELVMRMSRDGISRAAAHALSPDGWANAFLKIFNEKLQASDAPPATSAIALQRSYEHPITMRN
jgi:glycosyltransferase involved in cell wall biosynthesis